MEQKNINELLKKTSIELWEICTQAALDGFNAGENGLSINEFNQRVSKFNDRLKEFQTRCALSQKILRRLNYGIIR